MKWRRGEYNISGRSGTEQRAGWIHESGLFAIKKYGIATIITHMPTGFSLPEYPKTIAHAKLICEQLALKPAIWATGYKFGAQPNISKRQKQRRLKWIADAVKQSRK